MRKSGKKLSIGEKLLQHAIAFLVCVLFPGAVTMMAPASWLTFTRSSEIVSITASTCVFFVVPYKVQTLENVKQITYRERAGGVEKKRKYGRTTNETVSVDGEGFLQVHGANDRIAEVSVSPISLDAAVEKSSEFIRSNKRGSRTIFVIANWKFGAIMGGLLTSLTALYVVGYSLGFLRLVVVGLKRAFMLALRVEQ